MKDKNQADRKQKTATIDLPMRHDPDIQNQKVMIPDNPYSGNVRLTFCDDDLEARAEFIPPIGAGVPITVERVHTFLKQLNIIYGVQHEAIQKAVSDCTQKKQPVKDVLIAQGDPPVHEIAEYFELNSQLVPAPPPVKKNGQIDYREYSPFIIVKKDQSLAQLRPKVEGRTGKTIHNTPIPYKIISPQGVIGGIHTKTDEKYIIAEINGQFIKEKNLLHVQDCLIIKGGVGYATGNIIFPGEVIINGPVSDGFKIYADGSITIKQTLDLTEVMTKGDLNVNGGIIGRGRAIVKASGAIRTRFIENCHAMCQKTITVENEIINSEVFTMERIELGEKGFIIGSDITAIHGIRVGNIGKKTGKSSKLHCGIDFMVQQEIEKNNSQLQLLMGKEKKILELLPLPLAQHEKQVKLETWLHHIEKERYTLQNRLWDLRGRLTVDENAIVEVYGEVAPGTLIEICQIALFVAEPLRRVRVKLDTFLGKLVSQPL